MKPLSPGDPREIGGYRLKGRLGAGGMGEVFLAVDRWGNRVALKAAHERLVEHPAALARFRREVETVGRVRGRGTVPLVAADVDAERPWYATDFVLGPSLGHAVEDGAPMPEGTVWRLARGLAATLQDMHGEGLYHRDLKPSNVLLSAQGPMLIDFGIVHADGRTAITDLGRHPGTPGFASPEQTAGHRLTGASDIYSLGLVLAFAATGTMPTRGGVFPGLDGVPERLRPLVEECLEAEPDRRPSAARVLAVAEEHDRAGRHWLPEHVVTSIANMGEQMLALGTETARGRVATDPGGPGPAPTGTGSGTGGPPGGFDPGASTAPTGGGSGSMPSGGGGTSAPYGGTTDPGSGPWGGAGSATSNPHGATTGPGHASHASDAFSASSASSASDPWSGTTGGWDPWDVMDSSFGGQGWEGPSAPTGSAPPGPGTGRRVEVAPWVRSWLIGRPLFGLLWLPLTIVTDLLMLVLSGSAAESALGPSFGDAPSVGNTAVNLVVALALAPAAVVLHRHRRLLEQKSVRAVHDWAVAVCVYWFLVVACAALTAIGYVNRQHLYAFDEGNVWAMAVTAVGPLTFFAALPLLAVGPMAVMRFVRTRSEPAAW
ncbi:serine/threonine-protein kinase [Nocardiopsis sp. RSe5-2]|uniref:Serine/threonine-protein kinase n=1 Tax=Nocardiopsis endophytica TaxID=3018445 RepID=A0ABT4TZY6_9ACTN|nr:serine/threonine-protein kinase [Nocardiopsis endophytica]MDA2810268.1 serine/threonine-protein kinase [Nocardiopsis endophytica]